jgi:hypothetical protein
VSRLERLTDRRFKGGGFRETFLLLFTRKGDAAALRRTANLLTEMYRYAGRTWWPLPKEGDFYGLIHAALRDLRHVRDVLLWIDGGHVFDGYEAAVADLVGRCGADLEKVAATIEAGIADLPQLYDEYMRALDASVGQRPREHYEVRGSYGSAS